MTTTTTHVHVHHTARVDADGDTILAWYCKCGQPMFSDPLTCMLHPNGCAFAPKGSRHVYDVPEVTV